ncbi:PEP-CTERM sorting domain-containing protein [Hydrogenophaga sp. ANAO-22]|jgi:hypothetical protein|uniref:PEP-CTERM sorting domain-containing protein n=1 Tax=Hydrogenophaga sp. ANAO-22 TaxID=3166645 RepID=UPI0036D353D8
MKRLASLTRAACLALGLVAATGIASAADLDQTGGSFVDLTHAAGTFNPEWLGSAATYAAEFDLSALWRGAPLLLSQAATVTYTLVGFEAAYNNAFVAGLGQLSNQLNGIAQLGSSFSSAIDAGGALDFGFLSNGLGALWGNGSANVGVMLSADRQSALLLFNDSYADNDFDDMVVRVTIAAVPEPETLAMLLSGLGVVMVGARRRARKMAAAQAV